MATKKELEEIIEILKTELVQEAQLAGAYRGSETNLKGRLDFSEGLVKLLTTANADLASAVNARMEIIQFPPKGTIPR